MIKRLSALSGLAIVAVVCNHAAGYGQIAMFLWAHRYRPVTSPNWELIGTVPHYIAIAIRQFGDFAVPAFLFISGFFVAYASRREVENNAWKINKIRITNLFVPYMLWSFVVIIIMAILGTTYSPLEYLGLFFSQGIEPSYYFIPLLIYLYLISPFLANLSKSRWKIVLIISAVLMISTAILMYLNLFQIESEIITVLVKITPGWSLPHWIFFFALGIVSGLHLEKFRQFIDQYRMAFFIATPLLFILTIVESDALMRNTLSYWGAHIGSFSYIFFSLCFILCFIAIKKVPFERNFSRLGSKTYGIYLIHLIVIMLSAKFVYHFLPWILAYQTLYQPFLISAGLGIPLLLMAIVNKSFMRPIYRFIFG